MGGLALAPDGHLYVASDLPATLVQPDTDGGKVWSVTFENDRIYGLYSDEEYTLWAVGCDPSSPDGIAGNPNQNTALVRLSPAGAVLEAQYLDLGSGSDDGMRNVAARGGEPALAGYARRELTEGYLTHVYGVKLDATCQLEWEVAETTQHTSGEALYAVAHGADGNVLWTKQWDLGDLHGFVTDVAIDDDGYIYVAGYIQVGNEGDRVRYVRKYAL